MKVRRTEQVLELEENENEFVDTDKEAEKLNFYYGQKGFIPDPDYGDIDNEEVDVDETCEDDEGYHLCDDSLDNLTFLFYYDSSSQEADYDIACHDDLGEAEDD